MTVDRKLDTEALQFARQAMQRASDDNNVRGKFAPPRVDVFEAGLVAYLSALSAGGKIAPSPETHDWIEYAGPVPKTGNGEVADSLSATEAQAEPSAWTVSVPSLPDNMKVTRTATDVVQTLESLLDQGWSPTNEADLIIAANVVRFAVSPHTGNGGVEVNLRTLVDGFRLDWSGLRNRFEEDALRVEKLTTYESRAAYLDEMARQFEDAVNAALRAALVRP